MELVVDATARRVCLRRGGVELELLGQWAEFYLVLALERTDDASADGSSVTAEQLAAVGRWRTKVLASVGGEVSRHLGQQESEGWQDVVSHRRRDRTKRWRLELTPAQVHFVPSREDCVVWHVEIRRRVVALREVPSATLPWIRAVSEALIGLQLNRLELALSAASAAREATSEPLLAAVAELLEVRIRARSGDYGGLSEVLESGKKPALRSLRARAVVAQALNPKDSEARLRDLHRRAAAFEGDLPDINGLGHTYNALGVLYRRRGDLALSAGYLRDAVALLSASFDLPTLAAAIFNLGLTLYESADGDAEREAAREAILVAFRFQEEMNIGHDFSAGETIIGFISLELGEVDLAQKWLSIAKTQVRARASDMSGSAAKRLEARILWTESVHDGTFAQNRTRIRELYAEAVRLRDKMRYRKDDLLKEMELLYDGKRPAWMPKKIRSR